MLVLWIGNVHNFIIFGVAILVLQLIQLGLLIHGFYSINKGLNDHMKIIDKKQTNIFIVHIIFLVLEFIDCSLLIGHLIIYVKGNKINLVWLVIFIVISVVIQIINYFFILLVADKVREYSEIRSATLEERKGLNKKVIEDALKRALMDTTLIRSEQDSSIHIPTDYVEEARRAMLHTSGDHD